MDLLAPCSQYLNGFAFSLEKKSPGHLIKHFVGNYSGSLKYVCQIKQRLCRKMESFLIIPLPQQI